MNTTAEDSDTGILTDEIATNQENHSLLYIIEQALIQYGLGPENKLLDLIDQISTLLCSIQHHVIFEPVKGLICQTVINNKPMNMDKLIDTVLEVSNGELSANFIGYAFKQLEREGGVKKDIGKYSIGLRNTEISQEMKKKIDKIRSLFLHIENFVLCILENANIFAIINQVISHLQDMLFIIVNLPVEKEKHDQRLLNLIQDLYDEEDWIVGKGRQQIVIKPATKVLYTELTASIDKFRNWILDCEDISTEVHGKTLEFVDNLDNLIVQLKRSPRPFDV